jgi:hypothetical protein
LQFAELSNSLHAGTQEFANNFRQMAGALDSLASGLEYAQEKRREAEIGAVVGGLLLIGAIIQLGLDPVDDAATAAAVAETTALTAEATAAAAEATSVAVVALRVLATAMTAIRGLTAFVAATHLGAGLAAGGQTAMISWLASGKIDWNEIGPSVLFGTVTGLPIGKVGGALLRALRREGVPEVEAQALARKLEQDLNTNQLAKNASPFDRLPPYTGKKTAGILDTGSEQVDLVSGYAGPSRNMPRGTPGMNGRVKSHVEAHAAAIMREKNLTEADLYINRIPCGDDLTGCEQMLPRMLPPGARLTVHGPDGFLKTYVGLPD